MTLNQFKVNEQNTLQMNPLKALEGFYSWMMPIWAVASNVFDNGKQVHEDLLELFHETNEHATDRVVNAIDHNQPKDLLVATMVCIKSVGQANLTTYNACIAQNKLMMDAWFQILEKSHAQASPEANLY